MTLFQYLYKIYDRFMTSVNFPVFYCSQCEKKVRHWVYHFDGLVYCQSCADTYVVEVLGMGRVHHFGI